MSINKKINEALKALELKQGSTLPDIKKAFKKLALRYHPDKCCEEDKGFCEEKFIEINKAREYLENYYSGNYKYVDEEAQKRKTEDYKYYVEHFERFYKDFLF